MLSFFRRKKPQDAPQDAPKTQHYSAEELAAAFPSAPEATRPTENAAPDAVAPAPDRPTENATPDAFVEPGSARLEGDASPHSRAEPGSTDPGRPGRSVVGKMVGT